MPDLETFIRKGQIYTDSRVDEIVDKLNYSVKNLDNRIVELRKQFDVDIIMKQIVKKADGEQVNSDLKNHEFKIVMLDKNLM